MRVNALNVGLVFGAFLALWHACWSTLVALGWAQPVINFVLWAHFMKLPIQIDPFDIARAAILVGVTFVAGLTIGWIIGLFWNLSLTR
jgi:hypothetical protein